MKGQCQGCAKVKPDRVIAVATNYRLMKVCGGCHELAREEGILIKAPADPAKKRGGNP